MFSSVYWFFPQLLLLISLFWDRACELHPEIGIFLFETPKTFVMKKTFFNFFFYYKIIFSELPADLLAGFLLLIYLKMISTFYAFCKLFLRLFLAFFSYVQINSYPNVPFCFLPLDKISSFISAVLSRHSSQCKHRDVNSWKLIRDVN